MHLFLGLVPFVQYGIEISLAAPGLFDDDGYDPSSDLDIFSSDQANPGAPTTKDPTDFTMSLMINQEDLDPVASNNQLDWGTDDLFSYLGGEGNDGGSFQQDSDLLALNPSCAIIDVPGTQRLKRKKRDNLPSMCPNQLAPDGDSKSRGQVSPPTPGQFNGDHVNLRDFYEGRDRDTIRGYVPGKNSGSLCGSEEFAVCDSGDPYFRIPQIPPRYALERCFQCMFDSLLWQQFQEREAKGRDRYPSISTRGSPLILLIISPCLGLDTLFSPFLCYAPSMIWCCEKYYASVIDRSQPVSPLFYIHNEFFLPHLPPQESTTNIFLSPLPKKKTRAEEHKDLTLRENVHRVPATEPKGVFSSPRLRLPCRAFHYSRLGTIRFAILHLD